MAQERRVFRIPGLHCGSEVKLIKDKLAPLAGGEENLSFDIMQKKMVVKGSISNEDVLKGIAELGMSAVPWTKEKKSERPSHLDFTSPRFLSFILSGLVFAFGLCQTLFDISNPLYAYGASLILSIWPVLPKAYDAIRLRNPDMNLLITVAAAGAMGIGEWMEAAAVSFLFALSLLLESWSVDRARNAVEKLLDQAPTRVRVKQSDGTERIVAPEDVPVGSTFIVKPGEKIALDGNVTHGNSSVNQASITGESLPISKEPGDEVFAGTLNGEGLLEVESSKAADDTTLATVIRMVEDAQQKRAPSERWVEQFARVYTPLVMALALAVFVLPSLFAPEAWEDWLYRALVLLVIACPCALVISTPVSIVAALARSAREGVLVKGGLYLESCAKIEAIAFDKTGTLTQGRPQLSKLQPLNEHTEEQLLSSAAGLEARSEHPLAVAILDEAKRRGISTTPAADFKMIPGKGASGTINGRPYWLGSHRYLEERGQETPDIHLAIEALAEDGSTIVVIGTEDHVCGLLKLNDQPRPEAREAIEQLHQLGLKHTIMITGDNRPTAEVIGKALGVREVDAELLPGDKVEHVGRLVKTYGNVAMVGDGVNDAPAMARATVGISMGSVGSDAAIETSDVALMSEDLRKIPWLFRHSRRTVNIIRQNIVFSLATKGLVFALSLFGYATLWMAIAADTGTSLLVIFNGLRLLRKGGR